MKFTFRLFLLTFLVFSCKSRVSELSDLSVKNIVYYLEGEYVKRLECDNDEPTINRSCSGIVVLLEAERVKKLRDSLFESADPRLLEELGLKVLVEIVREDPGLYRKKAEMIETLLDPTKQVEITDAGDIEFLDRIFHGKATVEVKQVSAGYESTCAVIGNGKVKCWGDYRDLKYGYDKKWKFRDHERISASSPKSTLPIKHAVSVGAGAGNFCAILQGGTAKCWGAESPTLGYGDGRNKYLSEELPPLPIKDVSEISMGRKDTCAVYEGGKLRCWGAHINESGTVLDAGSDLAKINLEGVKQISGTYASRCALTKDGNALCWGGNIWGQLGIGIDPHKDEQPRRMPQKLELDNVENISAGHYNTCAILQGGSLRCWGSESLASRKLSGKDDVYDATSENAVVSLADASQVQVNDNNICVVTKSRELVCWGDGKYLAHGNGHKESTNRKYLTKLSLKNVESISGGYAHTCAILKGGRLKCWGDNRQNQLGIELKDLYYATEFFGDALSETIENIPFVFPVWKREDWNEP